MTRFDSTEQLANGVDGQRLRTSGDDAGQAQPAMPRTACALLTPEQMAEVVANRVVIEQTKGMLMLIYDVDADRAFDYLVWRSQVTNVKLRILAQDLARTFRARGNLGLPPTREAFDEVLLTARQRTAPGLV